MWRLSNARGRDAQACFYWLILLPDFARRVCRLILLSNFCRLQKEPHDNATKSSELRHRNAADI
jgi:hypothetical protein